MTWNVLDKRQRRDDSCRHNSYHHGAAMLSRRQRVSEAEPRKTHKRLHSYMRMKSKEADPPDPVWASQNQEYANRARQATRSPSQSPDHCGPCSLAACHERLSTFSPCALRCQLLLGLFSLGSLFNRKDLCCLFLTPNFLCLLL